MNTGNNIINEFKTFSEDRLHNHTAELDTRYQNRSIPDPELKEAYYQHRQILERELSDKIEELTGKGNGFLKGELIEVKDKTISKLTER